MKKDDKIFVELSSKKLAALGIDPQAIGQALAAQNALVAPGSVETREASVALRVTGQLDSVRAVSDLLLRAGGQTFRLGDIARVARGYADPPVSTMRFRGREGIGLAVSMTRNGDVLKLGADLKREMARLRGELPVGIEFEQVSDQPAVVKNSVGEFMRALGEAVAIVLAVSFLSLGVRTGLVVALTIPLVLAATFLGMLPGTFLSVYVGMVAADLSGASGRPRLLPGHWVLEGVGLACTALVVFLVTRRAHRLLRKRLEP